MENTTFPFYFNLTLFGNIGHYRFLAFSFCLLLYCFIISANLLMIFVIFRQRTLHEPMYMFIALLCMNSLYGSSGFFPRFLMDLLSDTHLITHTACFTQLYVIYTYACCEITILSIMAYDRYVAVCHPLHYHRKMTRKTVYGLAIFAWVYPTCNLTITVYMVVRLPLCGNNIERVYCATWNIVKLSCVTTSANNIASTLRVMSVPFVPLLGFILFSYMRIVWACWKKSSAVRGKVVQSCLPHIISFVTYCITASIDSALSRQDIKDTNSFLAVILSLEFVVVPPVMNPLVYGLKLPEIKRHVLRILHLKPKAKIRTFPEPTNDL
ncbi:olfactory receptor 10T2-like [Mugil cephalus]|uniref:olfactory receptor 10T2-like n=1 Tax=Mugil cephalus TaxID=48193 RepID=UPI001FB57706|nr:olfactory receptor 10T2-like [Mugil cephalus]